MSREKAKAEDGALVRAYKEAVTLREKLKSEGRSRAECDAVVAAALRRAWPFPSSSESSPFLCDACEDTGAIIHQCPAEPCQRMKPHLPHDYMTPCDCSKGDRFRPKEGLPTSHTAAGKPRATKPRWKRFGG